MASAQTKQQNENKINESDEAIEKCTHKQENG